jgi:3-oxoacyl-[acyl-carrier protein] reductase
LTEVAAGLELEGRVAIVTGAGGGPGGGIGAGIARVLSSKGARIAVNDISPEGADATVEELRARGVDAAGFVADIGDSGYAQRLVESVAEHFGRLDILVNNAGISGSHAIETMPDEEWHHVLDVNLSGPFYTSRAAIPFLKESGAGRVVYISSIAAVQIATAGGAAYTASKEGLLGLARQLAAEVGRFGITANAILPGMVLTPLQARVWEKMGEEAVARRVASIPAGRGATPDEIGHVVAFLASDGAAYVNGAAIRVDGAMTVVTP